MADNRGKGWRIRADGVRKAGREGGGCKGERAAGKPARDSGNFTVYAPERQANAHKNGDEDRRWSGDDGDSGAAGRIINPLLIFFASSGGQDSGKSCGGDTHRVCAFHFKTKRSGRWPGIRCRQIRQKRPLRKTRLIPS